MGCIASKPAKSPPPVLDKSSSDGPQPAAIQAEAPVRVVDEAAEEEHEKEKGKGNGKKLKVSKSKGSSSNFSLSLRFGPVKNQVAAEQSAAGWPAWLSAVAGEAIRGWVPLRADSFEKLEKIGQGTYSSVFRARENATGKIVALKKVRFDNYHPESVSFMAREITILRKLDHPNIMKLHGLITSRVSCSIYLVFEYMEHDLAGLLSSPEVQFTESQIKCFMQQLLYGLDYCHRRGVMHRDIKTSNILLNNDGILKIADFGLANFISTRYKQPLTSRVVTLWYRPPELLLGSTNYGAYVDMWSVGCVFAELLIGKPILKGKTEVEQLHKIFKLCGSPLEDYWQKSNLPHATMFKPQAPYESSLRERCKGFPEVTVNLLETFLSIDPQKRGTAASALMSEYFTTMPYACDPSSLPKYPPNKEIDAKYREDARRRTGRVQDSTSSSRTRRRGRKGLPEPSSVSMLGRPGPEDPQVDRKYARRNGTNTLVAQVKKPTDDVDMRSDVSDITNVSHGDIIFSRHALKLPKSGAFAHSDPSSVLNAENMLDSQPEEHEENNQDAHISSRGRDPRDTVRVSGKQQYRFHQRDALDMSASHRQKISASRFRREEIAAARSNVDEDNREVQ